MRDAGFRKSPDWRNSREQLYVTRCLRGRVGSNNPLTPRRMTMADAHPLQFRSKQRIPDAQTSPGDSYVIRLFRGEVDAQVTPGADRINLCVVWSNVGAHVGTPQCGSSPERISRSGK